MLFASVHLKTSEMAMLMSVNKIASVVRFDL